MGMSGCDISAWIWLALGFLAAAAKEEGEGEGRSLLIARWLGRDTDVGIDSGIGSDMTFWGFWGGEGESCWVTRLRCGREGAALSLSLSLFD